ncbi:4Fe-4S binding protein [Nitrospinota bacterium]
MADAPLPSQTSAHSAWAPVRRSWAKEARLWRFGVQLLVLLFITWIAIGHQWVGGGPKGVPSVEAYCPFGALEGLYQWVVTGTFMRRVHPSAFVILAAMIAVTIMTRKAFCSWICPFGTIQEWIGKAGKKLLGKRYNPTGPWDRALRPLKYVVLVVILLITWTTGTMVFREYDPFLAFFHFGIDFTEFWIGNLILIAVLVGSLVIDRFWCRYLCPLGAVIGIVGKAGGLGVSRNTETCTLCDACNTVCPMKVDPMGLTTVNSAECLQCLECVSICPEPDTLRLRLLGRSVRPAVFAVTVFVVFFGVLGAGRATGLWVTVGKARVTNLYGRLDPAGIRGYMSVEEISKGYGLPVSILMKKTGLPARVDPKTPIKKIAGKYELEFDPHVFRDVVAVLLKEKGISIGRADPAQKESHGPPTDQVAAAQVLDPDQVRGTWKLDELVKKSGTPKEKFAEALGFPAETAGGETLRGIAQAIGKSVEQFREVVRRQAQVPKMPGLHPEQIRGYWTLRELILQSGISKDTFAKKIGFPPDTPGKKLLKDIVRPMGKEVEEFRKVVKEESQKP